MRLRVLLIAGAVAALVVPAAQGGQAADPTAWLYNPLQVNAIDLTASPAALDSLRAKPTDYVNAQITLHDGATAFGPYNVGLKLKGQTSFRGLDGKAAFRVKFDYSVHGQEFQGLKDLTLNNMVEDPSMIAEAASSIVLRAIDVPAQRVGYAWVRLNGAVYGLYSNVETIDKVWAKRWFPTTQHIYEANYAVDVTPGGVDDYDVKVGSSKDRSDLEALVEAVSGPQAGWYARLKPVADLAEMARAFAAEHYIGQIDGYSYGSTQSQPNNYDLHSDDAGRFTMIVNGTDETWIDSSNFGVTGNGLLFRECVADPLCQPLYIAALRQIAANRQVAGLAATARKIQAVIAPWRKRDPRKEQSVAAGEALAASKIARMAIRPTELANWLR